MSKVTGFTNKVNCCIRDGCGLPFDPTIKESRPLDTLRAFWFMYCPKHRPDPQGNTNVITAVYAFKSFEAMFEHVCERFQISGNNDLDSNNIVFETPDGLRIVRWHVFERNGKVVIVPSDKHGEVL